MIAAIGKGALLPVSWFRSEGKIHLSRVAA